MKQFSESQQHLLRVLSLTFNFAARNIKCCVIAFKDEDAAQNADQIVETAEKAGLIQYYRKNVVPDGLDGDRREQYQKFGRALTLTDDAANWLASKQVIKKRKSPN